MKFQKGDLVHVDNGVKLYNGTPLSEYVAEVVKVADEYLFLKFLGKELRYVAHQNSCRKARKRRV
ncbi:MAG: hypothetical protein E7262_09570 [Lachnospiraceae bacterium]|nr:hypothetical protein [Lachnospiraceae bacterium]